MSNPHIPTVYEVETFSGLFVDTKFPKASTITLEDIAHALAATCRYGGHCREFYSVAEHAVFVSRRLERKGYKRSVIVAGLHHDDAEAYLGDIPRPTKALLGKVYKILTARMDKAIAEALGFSPAVIEHMHDGAVKDADNWALFVEARHLLPSEGRMWTGHPDALSWADGQPSRIITPDYWSGGLPPKEAEALFLARHKEITNA